MKRTILLGAIVLGLALGFAAPVFAQASAPFANQIPFACFVDAVTATTQCQGAPPTGFRLYLTSYILSNEAGTANNIDLVYGSGSNCATGTVTITHKHQFLAQGNFASGAPIVITIPGGNAVCVRPSAATAFGGTVTGFIAP